MFTCPHYSPIFCPQEKVKQNFSLSCAKTRDIIELNRTTLDELMKEGDTVVDEIKYSIPRRSVTPSLAVHPTIIQLIKVYPKLKIPNDTLKCDIQPSVVLDKREVENWKLPAAPIKIKCEPNEISAMERFKLMCPGINITKVSTQTATIERKSVVSPVNTVVIERRTSKSPCTSSDVSKRKRCDSSRSIDKSTKKKHRSQTPNISSTSGTKQVPKLIVNIRKSSLEVRPVQEICDRPMPSTSTPTSGIYSTRPSSISASFVTGDVDVCSDSDTDDITPKKPSGKKRKLKSDSDDSDYRPDADEVANLSDSLLDTMEEEIVINCGICNRMFKTKQQLKNHERVHRRCTICNGIFRTNEILRYHQQEICFKRIITNSPMLELTRVDEMPEVLKAYPNAFNPELKDTFEIQPRNVNAFVLSDDDDDVILIEDDGNPTSTQNSICNSPEYKHICEIFRKYQNLKVPPPRHKSTDTKPRINVKYNSKNQIVLENMYEELQRYRVPVELAAKSTSFAYITFTKKQPKPKDIYCWVNEPVIGLIENKDISLINLLNSPSAPTWTRINVSLPLPSTSVEGKNTTRFVRLQPKPPSTSTTVNKQSISNNVMTNLDKDKVNPTPSTSGVSRDTGFSLRIKTPSELNTY